MSEELRESIPSFNRDGRDHADAASDWSAVSSVRGARNAVEALLIIMIAVIVVGGAETLLRTFDVPSYIVPLPSAVFYTLFTDFGTLYWPHLLVTLQELLTGYVIGAATGIVLAAVITQVPLVERLITPYILIAVTTPMLALVPLLMLVFGFGSTPRIIAVALATGPLVMINSATGFGQVDPAKLALARSYGASTLDTFIRIRVPSALPMINTGLMVGSIFALLTAVGAEMVAGSDGLGNRLVYFASLTRMDSFFATISIIAAIGISVYVIFYLLGKRWTRWQG